MGGERHIETVSISGSTYQKNEQKFEAGTPRIAEEQLDGLRLLSG